MCGDYGYYQCDAGLCCMPPTVQNGFGYNAGFVCFAPGKDTVVFDDDRDSCEINNMYDNGSTLTSKTGVCHSPAYGCNHYISKHGNCYEQCGHDIKILAAELARKKGHRYENKGGCDTKKFKLDIIQFEEGYSKYNKGGFEINFYNPINKKGSAEIDVTEDVEVMESGAMKLAASATAIAALVTFV